MSRTRLRLPRGTVIALALFVVAQWISIAIFASIVRNNGWLF